MMTADAKQAFNGCRKYTYNIRRERMSGASAETLACWCIEAPNNIMLGRAREFCSNHHLVHSQKRRSQCPRLISGSISVKQNLEVVAPTNTTKYQFDPPVTCC